MSSTFDRDSIHRHPLTFTGLLIAAETAVNVVLAATRDLLSLHVSILTTGIISGAVLSLLGALVIGRLGLWRELGLIGHPARRRTLLWCLPFAIYGVLPLTMGLDVTAGRIATAIAFGVLIAFWKLAVVGLVLYALLPRGARAAAALTACSFAIMHLGGILVGGVVVPTLVESLSYLFLGFAFVAVRLRIRLLWPLVCCYSLFLTTVAMVFRDNGASNLAGSVSDMLPAVFTSVLLAGYGLLVWRRPSATAEPAGHLGDGPGVTSENPAGPTHSPGARARRVVTTHD
jgi:hypothetical protein